MPARSYTQVLDQPAPGHDWSFVPSTSDWSRLLSIVGTLTSNATSANRQAAVTVTDETGNVIALDIAPVAQTASDVGTWSWRSGTTQYGGGSEPEQYTNSLPGFWLPPGSTVAALTAGLVANAPQVQASANFGANVLVVPQTITTGSNDEFVWTGTGGAGSPVTYTVAAGTYTTFAQEAAALNTAVNGSAQPFSAQALFTANPGTGAVVLTAVADQGAAGNLDAVSAGANDVLGWFFTNNTYPALSGGVNALAGDQWTDVVATYVVADKWHWETLEALLSQVAPGQ